MGFWGFGVLGWSPESDKEILNIKEIVELFKEDKIHKGGARFDFEKAVWLNQKHIQKKAPEKLLEKFPEFFKNIADNEKLLVSLIALIQERASLLTDFEKESFLFTNSPAKYDINSLSRLDEKKSLQILKYLHDSLNNKKFVLDNWKSEMMGWGKQEGFSAKEIMQTIRMALVGSLKGPDLVSISSFIGKDAFLKRLNSFIGFLK